MECPDDAVLRYRSERRGAYHAIEQGRTGASRDLARLMVKQLTRAEVGALTNITATALTQLHTSG